MKIRTPEDARALRTKMETLSLRVNDDEAKDFVEFFPVWSSSKAYSLNNRVQFNDKVYKFISEISGLTSEPNNDKSWVELS